MARLDQQESAETSGIGSHPDRATPPFHEGQRLDQPAFHELYSTMPEGFRAELIDGVVYLMNRPVFEDHGRPDLELGGLLYLYSVETPGVHPYSNTSTILGPRSEVQPDSALLIDPACGGQTFRDARGCTNRCPEFVVEIASSSHRRDLNTKKKVYEEAGALEYLVFDVVHPKFHWFALREGRFKPLDADADGVYRSRALPGFRLDAAAFVRGDQRAVVATLRRGLESPEHATFVDGLAQYRANRP